MNTDTLNTRLDQAEDRLPPLPARLLHLNRTVTARMVAQARRNNELVTEALEAVGRVASQGFRTVTGTARSAAEETTSTAVTGARQVTGQARAQAARAASVAEDEAVDVTDEIIDRVETSVEQVDRAHLRSMSKSELYEQAQDLDVEGRSTMSKSELVEALAVD